MSGKETLLACHSHSPDRLPRSVAPDQPSGAAAAAGGRASRRALLVALGTAAVTAATRDRLDDASARPGKRQRRKRRQRRRRQADRAAGGGQPAPRGAGPTPTPSRAGRIGTTFSQRQCDYLGLDVQTTFAQVCELGLDVVRLCCYWDEIEPREGKFTFAMMDTLLDTAATYRLPVILAVGMKAPRWPEFHFPTWVARRYPIDQTDQPLDAIPGLADQALAFVSAATAHLHEAPGIVSWQIENEPFHALPITGNRYLSPQFVAQEAALVRQASSPRQHLLATSAINLWPPEGKPEDDDALAQAIALSDAVGINVYGKVPIGADAYLEPSPTFWDKLEAWRPAIETAGREAWIAELQAEPWELAPWDTVRDWQATPSASPQQTTALMDQVTRRGYDTVLLWGCEYWVYRHRQGDRRWWNSMQRLIHPA